MNSVFQANPDLRNNLTAVAYLRDRTLLISLGNPDTVRKLAEENRDFLDAADVIVKSLTTVEPKVPVEEIVKR